MYRDIRAAYGMSHISTLYRERDARQPAQQAIDVYRKIFGHIRN